jgi:type I restriction enzyme S subunit
LEHETAKIDTLVEEQRRLIELLKEKRQAVISHAVTKGLNPDAPMKDSGIEWLGEVPSNWNVSMLKHSAKRITDGAHVSPETENGEFFFVSTKDITDSAIDFSEAILTSAASYAALVKSGCKPQKGDVLFSKDGTIGKTIVIREDLDFVVASSLIIITPDESEIESNYLNYLCQSAFLKGQVEAFVKGAGLPRLSLQNLLKVLILSPNLNEQLQITAFLDREIARFDALLAEVTHAIDLLQERRSALISTAVTGKIDVRGLPKEETA